jgi:hypothetical protein
MIEIYDRTAFSVFIFEIPHLRGKELKEATRIKLIGMYPETPDKKNIFIEKNGNKKWSYIIFVLNKYENHILPLSTLFMRNYFSKKDGKAVYLEKKWVEFITIQKGCIIKNSVRRRGDTELSEYITDNFESEPGIIDVFCYEDDKIIFSEMNGNHQYTLHSIKNELKNCDILSISLNRSLSPVVKRRRIFITGCALFFITGIFFILYHYHMLDYEKEKQSRIEQENSERLNEERRKKAQILSELQAYYEEMTAHKKTNPFEMSIIISECLETSTRIQSVTFNEKFFQIDGITSNSLVLLHNFETDKRINTPRLHQVHSLNNMDTFTLSGSVLPYFESVNGNLPLEEQISRLETLIENEKKIHDEPVSGPAEFGDIIKNILLKRNCSVTTFQYLGENNAIAIEYNLKSTSEAFFGFLYEISKHAAWEIPMLQIRNLYPLNSMDIVFRISTDYNYNEKMSTGSEPVNIPEPYPFTKITRNYFNRPIQPGIRINPPTEAVKPVIPISQKAERVTWLEYVGTIRDGSGEPLTYIKNTKTGEILKLSASENGGLRYITTTNGTIHAYIDGVIYEIATK